MTHWRRLLGLGIAGAGLLSCAVAAPHYLRRLEAFRVTQVEVTGTRYLEPYDAMMASRIGPRSSVFDDPTPWRDSLRAHPLVADAHVARRPPGTVRIHVIEADPVALARTPALRPVDVRGRVLPIDPAAGELDLPVLATPVERSEEGHADARSVRTLQGLVALRSIEPTIWAWVSEAHAGDAHMRLILRWPRNAELLLGLPVDAGRLDEIRLVLADLAAAGDGSLAGAEAAGARLARLQRIDARFQDQVVVSLDVQRRTNTRDGS